MHYQTKKKKNWNTGIILKITKQECFLIWFNKSPGVTLDYALSVEYI